MSGESSEVFASASVLVDGCRVPELEDKDGPRDWDWLAWTLPEREVASVRNCDNQHQRLIATTTGDYFEILLSNDHSKPIAVKAATFQPPPDTSLAATLGNAEKKRVFGQEAAFDDKVEISLSIGSIVQSVYDKDNVLATFSWRYAAIEGLQIAKTNPKAWQDWQWHQIESARVASRELRKSLRGASRSRSPIKTAKEWLTFVQARRAAHDGAMAANQIYDDDLARSSDPPPLVPFDHVLVRAAQGSDVDYEGVVLAAGSTDTEVRVKEAFSNVFGVMLYLLMVAGADKKLRVARRHAPPGRRVLINGIAVAHLGGAFDSIERHNEIIEIQSGDESDEDDAAAAGAARPRKKSWTSKFAKVKADPGAVKSERRA
ncbi:hypothetical protein SO694_00001123 [Aureococcus anophagefferens]|uniref:Uncharacterized protein n=1 Tax=Aureococcus anophagefferens TaxID=44056 RepID=A0ABR1GCM3_AURAN